MLGMHLPTHAPPCLRLCLQSECQKTSALRTLVHASVKASCMFNHLDTAENSIKICLMDDVFPNEPRQLVYTFDIETNCSFSAPMVLITNQVVQEKSILFVKE